MYFPPDPVQEINAELIKLRHKTQESDEGLKKLKFYREVFVIQYQKSSTCEVQIEQNSDQGEKLIYDFQQLLKLRMELYNNFLHIYIRLKELQKKFLETHLIKWKRAQQLYGNGVPFQNNLEKLQEWCEMLADIIWQIKLNIGQIENLFACFSSPEINFEKLSILKNYFIVLLSSLITNVFIIEKQPPQVIKTNTRFSTKVRLLVGSKLGVSMSSPQVKVTIVSEAQALELIRTGKNGIEASGVILNNMGTMEYYEATGQLSISFQNLQLQTINRAQKKGLDSVMDEKFSLLFQTQFQVGGGDLNFQVWTLSLPIVVIVHGNQDPYALATITWDNAFGKPGRELFKVPDKVHWKEVAAMLRNKFKSYTGCALSEDNLQLLARKVLRTSGFVKPEAQVTLSQFCKESLPRRKFTFWEWFYGIMKVTREHLSYLWNEGHIMGFVDRQHAEELLLQKCNGTFLLRFSDSVIGGVTIAWVADSQARGSREVFMVEPITSRDFLIRSISDRIYDFEILQYLYPALPKDQAFKKYYTLNTGVINPNGYINRGLISQLPGFVAMQ
ncbi:signal transducer and activator of transcription 5B [Caerostris darwini]|uniref:Signal transducer and transcription activator n=1 Tax=Caerostris darwini TaxID=1538125 RepID=A0AAV4W8T8_9ARAC|nr:signal transducer and activator of transcription 5B [Caerostris darwini]